MVRGKIWFRCAVVHDPVCPKVVKPSIIGWEAKQRQIDLTIERAFKGDELVSRMKGWITAEPKKVIDIVNLHGRFKVLDDSELVVETETEDGFNSLQTDLKNIFGNEVELEIIKKQR